MMAVLSGAVIQELADGAARENGRTAIVVPAIAALKAKRH
jgi:hypothetical protein